MTHLTTVVALNLGPVLGLRTVAGEVTLLLAVAACSGIGVTRLIALLCNVVLGSTVAAGPRSTRFDVGALSNVSSAQMSQ
jgi:hypothetical protein